MMVARRALARAAAALAHADAPAAGISARSFAAGGPSGPRFLSDPKVVTAARQYQAEKSARHTWGYEATAADGRNYKMMWAWIGGVGGCSIAYNLGSLMMK